MMKQMMGDMKIGLRLVIDSGIAETNATHREANTVTLVEMEMGKVLENPDNIKKLGKVDQANPAAAMEMMKGMPGIKLEAQKEISIRLE
ncbi:hypothetical protein F8S12_00580 [Nostoc sp. WHI]|nr:hypothetical protein [Nostoc sp. WHI]